MKPAILAAKQDGSMNHQRGQFRDDRFGRAVGEGALVEQDVAGLVRLFGEQVHHLPVGQRAIGVVRLAAELAGVEQRHDVEARQQPGIAGVDVAEIGAVAVRHARIVGRERDRTHTPSVRR
ncbi:hypothetical protein [Bosea thiooxidans]